MNDSVGPLLSAGYDVAWTAILVLQIALVMVALVSIARSARRLTSTQALIWTLMAIFVPIAGPLAWLLIGRRSGLAASP